MAANQSRPRHTDERLRSWLDANQLDRERMCQALLALDRRFVDVRPRHPRGGRDGARDLEAQLVDGRHVWVAVGFRNSATDSKADKNWVKKKFADDLQSAINAFAGLNGFVFMTNVELTVNERDSLVRKAKKSGLEFADVFHRERLRIFLDSPDGLAARYQYLGLALSEEEQATFFARWGSQLEEIISREFASVDRKLARLEFLQHVARPLRSVGFSVDLKHTVTPAELGHFRVQFVILDLEGDSPYLDVELCVRSGVPGSHADGEPVHSGGAWVTLKPTVGEENREDRRQLYSFSAVLPDEVHRIGSSGSVGGWLQGDLPRAILGDLDGGMLALFVTEPLADKVASVRFFANGYTLFEATGDSLVPYRSPGDKWANLWPLPLSSAEVAVPWVRLDALDGTPTVNFSAGTPPRLHSR